MSFHKIIIRFYFIYANVWADWLTIINNWKKIITSVFIQKTEEKLSICGRIDTILLKYTIDRYT